jgi:hypothetical protein
MNGWLYILCGLIAVLGRVVGLVIGARRELANRTRQFRLERLAGAWRSIQVAATDPGGGTRLALDTALMEVQLFGTPLQVEAATRTGRAVAAGAELAPVLAELLEALRRELRREMRLGHETSSPSLRFDGTSAEPGQTPATIPSGPHAAILGARSFASDPARTSRRESRAARRGAPRPRLRADQAPRDGHNGARGAHGLR